jgi:hypothetical protein
VDGAPPVDAETERADAEDDQQDAGGEPPSSNSLRLDMRMTSSEGTDGRDVSTERADLVAAAVLVAAGVRDQSDHDECQPEDDHPAKSFAHLDPPS